MPEITIKSAPQEYQKYLTIGDAKGNFNGIIDTESELQIAIDEYCNENSPDQCTLFKQLFAAVPKNEVICPIKINCTKANIDGNYAFKILPGVKGKEEKQACAKKIHACNNPSGEVKGAIKSAPQTANVPKEVIKIMGTKYCPKINGGKEECLQFLTDLMNEKTTGMTAGQSESFALYAFLASGKDIYIQCSNITSHNESQSRKCFYKSIKKATVVGFTLDDMGILSSSNGQWKNLSFKEYLTKMADFVKNSGAIDASSLKMPKKNKQKHEEIAINTVKCNDGTTMELDCKNKNSQKYLAEVDNCSDAAYDKYVKMCKIPVFK